VVCKNLSPCHCGQGNDEPNTATLEAR
jgi:hypothetical protein